MDNLSLRKELKNKKPSFRRQDSHKKKRVSRTGYRRPKGLQSKVRLNKRGYVKKVRPGYGSPSDVKGMHPKGLFPFVVDNVNQLEAIDTTREGVVISSNVGVKKKLQIISEAISKKIVLLNVKDPDQFVKDAEESMKQRKDIRKSLKADKKKKEEKKKNEKVGSTADKKVDTENSESDSSSPDLVEEKKKKEKEEKDKVLTKKE